MTLEQLGFSSDNLQKVQQLLQIPSGIVLICGPTGSGKTTTLAVCWKFWWKSGKKYCDAEDPVEYEMAGIIRCRLMKNRV